MGGTFGSDFGLGLEDRPRKSLCRSFSDMSRLLVWLLVWLLRAEGMVARVVAWRRGFESKEGRYGGAWRGRWPDLILKCYAPYFFKVSSDIANETWVVGGASGIFSRSRSLNIRFLLGFWRSDMHSFIFSFDKFSS
ncbi:hypothetical protein Syun_017538 [Stephania yunnanensis]|uniref:Uncharacterized protein n=1 Tax=Stephania yunnanensis TaxID=152371 RepID=A0AAP0P5X9_9MAGN